MSQQEPKYLRLATGELIDTSNGKRVVDTDINRAFSDQPGTSISRKKASYDGGMRRFVDDLPAPPNQSKAIAAVAAFALFGLNEADTAHVLGTDLEVVEGIKKTDSYLSFIDAMLQNIREHDKDKVRKKINDAAEQAASRITTFVNHPDSKIALAAAKDVLDRAANGAYNAETGKNQSALTIRIITDADNPADKIKVDIDG